MRGDSRRRGAKGGCKCLLDVATTGQTGVRRAGVVERALNNAVGAAICRQEKKMGRVRCAAPLKSTQKQIVFAPIKMGRKTTAWLFLTHTSRSTGPLSHEAIHLPSCGFPCAASSLKTLLSGSNVISRISCSRAINISRRGFVSRKGGAQ